MLETNPMGVYGYQKYSKNVVYGDKFSVVAISKNSPVRD